ncbi:BolA family transcriptional regulator [Rickettsiales bacterium Ac37b]|nr:BolA family transcriptional regulator [Rickettsiales bacterium Ac37b]
MKLIEEKLKILDPLFLEIKDDTDKHSNHFTAIPGVITHLSVSIVSDKFMGLNKVERHRMVYNILQDDLREYMHALSLKTMTRDEYIRK